MTPELKLPEEKIRSLIIWGLSHDYKRVLKTLRKTVSDISKMQDLARNPKVQATCRSYLSCCDAIENFLDTMVNTLDRQKSVDIIPLLQEQTKPADEFMERLISGAGKISTAVDSEPHVPNNTRQTASILIRQTRRAQLQMKELWAIPFGQAGRPITFRVKREIWRILTDLSSLFTTHRASIRDNVHVSSGHILHTDRALFSVAVSNIIANAVVHSRKGRNLAIQIAESVEEDLKTGGQYLNLSITDNGPGIPLAEQQAIFDLFRQGTQTHTDTGSGVGLTFAELAMDLLGGSVMLKSVPGHGATFTLKFPLAQPQVA